MRDCPYCHGTGTQYVESGSSLSYACPDCGGSGTVAMCEYCGREVDGDFCTYCYTECEGCGGFFRIGHDISDGGDLCYDCESVVADARSSLHDMGIASYRISDAELAEVCKQSRDEVVLHISKLNTRVSGDYWNSRYAKNIKELCMCDDHKCQTYDAVRCGFCGEYGVSVEFIGTEKDADGVFENWRSECLSCHKRSLDMDDPAYAVEVLVVGDADGCVDVD